MVAMCGSAAAEWHEAYYAVKGMQTFIPGMGWVENGNTLYYEYYLRAEVSWRTAAAEVGHAVFSTEGHFYLWLNEDNEPINHFPESPFIPEHP